MKGKIECTNVSSEVEIIKEGKKYAEQARLFFVKTGVL